MPIRSPATCATRWSTTMSRPVSKLLPRHRKRPRPLRHIVNLIAMQTVPMRLPLTTFDTRSWLRRVMFWRAIVEKWRMVRIFRIGKRNWMPYSDLMVMSTRQVPTTRRKPCRWRIRRIAWVTSQKAANRKGFLLSPGKREKRMTLAMTILWASSSGQPRGKRHEA